MNMEAEEVDQSTGELARTTTEVQSPTQDVSYLQTSLIFIRTFFGARGAVPILVSTTLIALGLGSVVAVIPDVVADRYARIRYDYDGANCATIDRLDKPDACQKGADDAQAAAAASALAMNLLTLIFNPVVGSFSDVRGRRGVILVSLLLYSLGTIVLMLLQMLPWMSPNFYYVAASLVGAVDFMSMTFAAISDVLPEQVRAAGYGFLLAAFYFGYSAGPSLPLIMSHFQVSIFSCTVVVLALFVGIVALPETLPETIAEQNLQSLQEEEQQQLASQRRWSSDGSSYSDAEDTGIFLEYEGATPEPSWLVKIMQTASRPIRDMSILTRGSLPILSAASFFSAMVYSSDKTFVIYYIMDQLNVRDGDIARMFVIFGPVGVILQAFCIQPLLRVISEKHLLILTFLSGTCHNSLYGLARSQSTIIVALCLSQVTKLNFPILASYASRSASANEQGRVQGALFALNALANAAGPMVLEQVYDRTKNGHNFLGPGAMFLCASGLYGVGTALVSFLPATTETRGTEREAGEGDERGHNTLLLPGDSNSMLGQPLLLSATNDEL